jgi:hypothetical protein
MRGYIKTIIKRTNKAHPKHVFYSQVAENTVNEKYHIEDNFLLVCLTGERGVVENLRSKDQLMA